MEKVTTTACKDPQNYVSWDGLHTTEAAKILLTNAILDVDGSYFDPPPEINQFSDIQPIG